MLGYVGGIGESRHNLIPGELIVFLDVFDLVPGGKSTEDRVATSILVPLMQGLPKRTPGSIVMPG
jgi:hypothetical protein